MKRFYFWAVILLLSASSVMAEFNAEMYRRENPASLSPSIFYPDFFKTTDPITMANLIREFKHRYEFFVGISSESRQKSCFKIQNRVNQWLKKFQQAKKIDFKWADDELIFNEESPLFLMIRPGPFKSEDNCKFLSYGDIASDGGVFCCFHGPDPQSEFYQAHVHQFVEARPFFTAYDLTEILIFLPFILVLPVSWLIMKKFLAKG
ncbi:MAG: hypothetical protein AB1403_01345 [Candidatus Riflebacteria bacterium]